MIKPIMRAALWAAYGAVLAVGIPAHLVSRCATVAALVIDELLRDLEERTTP